MRAIAIDVFDGFVDASDHFDRDDRRKKLGGVVVVRGWLGGAEQRLSFCATADFDMLAGQHGGDWRKQFGSARTGNKQRFGGVTGAVTLRLGVLDDTHGHVGVGRVVEINVAIAVEMLDHRHARFGEKSGDQSFAAARNNDVDVLAQCDQVADSGTVGGVNDLDRVWR